MDPIKRLQAQISALKAKGNPADKDKLAELEAKLQKAMLPNGNNNEDKGLRVQRAQDAASKYCKYTLAQDPDGYNNEALHKCTEYRTEKITLCEDINPTMTQNPTELEKECIDANAKINKPSKKAQTAAESYCRETFKNYPRSKDLAIKSCTQGKAQIIADCTNIPGITDGSTEAENECIGLHTDKSHQADLRKFQEAKDRLKQEKQEEQEEEERNKIFKEEYNKQLKKELKKHFPKYFSPDGKDHSTLDI